MTEERFSETEKEIKAKKRLSHCGNSAMYKISEAAAVLLFHLKSCFNSFELDSDSVKSKILEGDLFR